MGLVFLGWIVIRALRRPDLSAALSAINPALNDQPLLFFDRVKGVTCLNDAAEQILNNLPASQQQSLLDALADTLLEAYEEARITRQRDWPEADYTLVAAPIFGQPDDVAGVLALVITEIPLPPAARLVDEHLAAETQVWLTLGPTLRLHRTRPVVHVRRISPTTVEITTATWQEYQLSPTEETLLRYLVEHPAEVQTAEMLFRVVWPEDEVDRYGLRPGQKNRLQRLVCQSRRHVEPDPHNPRYVCTAHGVGYVLYLEREPIIQ
jgi:DNA-binding winged helix-turn-helix (wHTH) protein